LSPAPPSVIMADEMRKTFGDWFFYFGHSPA
jgi:hypothetical protein